MSITVRVTLQQQGTRTDAQTSAREAARNADQAARSADQARANADQARANADRIIENAIRDAEQATNRSTEGLPAPPAPPAPPGTPTGFRFDSESPFSFDFQNGSILLEQNGQSRVIPLRDAIPREAAQIAWAVPATLSIFVIWWPISRAVIRWLNRKHASNVETASLEARLRERMDTMERNLDTVAVEMERLSEGQRFTNKLLAQRAEHDERVPVNVPR